jgi:hypothetical protein
VRESHIIALHSRYLRSIWQSQKTFRREALATVEWSAVQAPLDVDSRQNTSGEVESSQQVDLNWEEVLMHAIGLGESDSLGMGMLLGDWDEAGMSSGMNTGEFGSDHLLS